MSYDGKVIIEVELTTDKLKDQINQLKNAFNDLGDVGNIFGNLGSLVNTFGSTFKALSRTIGPTAAGIVAAIVTIVTAFNKLYEASKQNFFENLHNISQKLQPIVDTVKSATSTILDCFSQVTDFSFDFSSLIADAIEFESSMARVSAIMGVTGEDIKVLTETTRQYGATTRYTSLEVSEAFQYMGMAGFSLQESLSSIQDVLNLTTIGATELGTASDIVTDGLTAMNMSASQASNFVDYMASTITRSNTTVELMGETMKYAGSVAGTLGISMDDLSVAIGLMANSSIKGSRAGTAMRTLLANLSAPTDTVAKAMQKYGIELITASDGSVDLDKTLRNLRQSLKSLPLVEQAAACKNLAGKTGMTGLLAIVNATDDAYNSLTDSVQNSTQTVSYWNQNLGEAGITGKECSKRINNLKEVLSETEYLGAAFNMTTQDMALALQVLGADAKVTSKDVEDLFSVLDAMRNPTKYQKKEFRELGLSYKEINDDAFDYSATCDMINENTKGIVDTTKGLKDVVSKQDIINKLSPDMSLKEANAVLKEYGLSAKSASTGQIDLIGNLTQLRETFGDMDKSTREQTLSNLGLYDSLDEINEICSLSDEQFKTYCDNLNLVTGLSEKMADAMDETTKNKLLILASALQDVAIQGFEFLKPSIQNAAVALAEFFTLWRSGNKEGNTTKGQQLYTFENFKLALDNLLQTIKNADISGAIATAINNAKTFITQGGLSGILNIGTEIIHQICQGIIKSEDSIRKGISSAIKQIASFVKTNAKDIKEAGKVILEGIRDGIKDNKTDIHEALEAVTDTMDSWIQTSEQIKSLTGHFADVFIDSFIENLSDRTIGKGVEFWNAITGWITEGGDTSEPPQGLLDTVFNKIGDWIFGNTEKSYAGEKDGTEKPLNTGKKSNKSSKSNTTSNISSMTSKEIETLNYELTKLQTTSQTVSNMVSSSFTSMQNTIRSSLVGCANIARNQFVSIANIVRNQSLNCSNIVRNQFISINNVIRNQSLNARNSLTTQFISMRKVATTQATATRNAVTTQMISMRKVVTTQSRAARNSFTSQMISMRKVASTQSKLIGEQIANGLTTGLKNGAQSAVDAARDLVNQVNAEMKKTAKINSPSKITIGYGEGLDEGWIVGMKNKARDMNSVAKDTIINMSNAMKTAVQGEMAQFAINASSNNENRIVNNINNNFKLSDEDIEKLADANAQRPVYTETKVGETTFVKGIAKPLDKYNKQQTKRLNRLEGVTNV